MKDNLSRDTRPPDPAPSDPEAEREWSEQGRRWYEELKERLWLQLVQP